MNGRPYTQQQLDWLKERHDMPRHHLAELFNATFNDNRSTNAIKVICQKYGFLTSHCGRRQKGQTPWNKGKKGYMGANVTSFKSGNIPASQRPVGYERLGKHGYIEIKVAEGMRQFRRKHRVLWEQQHGPIPRGFTVVFLDGDKTNLDLTNLTLVKRSELATLNRHEQFGNQSPEIKQSLIALTRLKQTIKAQGKT